MEKIYGILSDKFVDRGFLSVEFPRLMKDISYITSGGMHNLRQVNEELEQLGWGIQALRASDLDQIVHILENGDDRWLENQID
jgi:hypothetical protein